MDKSIYLKNYKALKKENEYIFEEIGEYKNSEETFEVCLFENANKTKSIYLDFGNKGIVQLASQYIPEFYAEKWVDRCFEKNSLKNNSIIVCFGMGSTEYIMEIVSRIDEKNVVIIYEPSLKVLDCVIRNIDLEKLLDSHVYIFSSTEKGKRLFRNILESIITPSYYELIKYIDLPNYNRIFRKEYEEYKKMITDTIKEMSININTRRNFAKLSAKNKLNSLGMSLDSYSVCALMDRLPKDKAAVIISAGPSLQKNIHQLKLVKDKMFLVATDTALKPLLQNGVIPDLYVTLDGEKDIELFEDERIKNIPVLALFAARKEVLELNENKIFFSCRNKMFDRIISKIDKENKKKYTDLLCGGSVATLAFSFLAMAKIEVIVFVGQDLAYTGDKKHIEGAFEDKQDATENDRKHYIYVEDINGELVPTVESFELYRRWFEEAIDFFADSTYIDATEGGAKINGTEIMTFREVIDKHSAESVKFAEIIDRIEPLFEDGVRIKFYQELLGLNDDLQLILEKSEALLECYKEVQKIGRKDIIVKDDLIEQFSQIRRYTKYLDEEAVLTSLLDEFMSTESIISSLGEDQIFDDIHEELEDLSKRAIIKVQSLIDGANELKPQIKEFVENIREKYKKEYNEEFVSEL